MKPNTTDAMYQLISEIRAAIPFHLPEEEICSGICQGCAKKLLEYLDAEVSDWESRLSAGQVPNFGELKKLARSSAKIHKALQRSLGAHP